MIDRKTWELLRLADFAEKALMPVSGGVLDQSESFLSACRFVWSETSVWKAKAGIK